MIFIHISGDNTKNLKIIAQAPYKLIHHPEK